MVADAEAGSVDDTDEPIGESEGGQVTAETRQSMETSDSTETSPEDENGSSNAREYVSFEEHFSGMAEDVYGDMGPEPKDDGRGRRRRRGRR